MIKLRVFVFALYPKPRTRRWKTSEFDQTASEKTRGSVLSAAQIGKLRVAEPRGLIKMPQKNSGVFISEFLVMVIVQNVKLGVEKSRKFILRGFRVFRELRVLDLTGHFVLGFPLRLERWTSDTRLNIFRFFACLKTRSICNTKIMTSCLSNQGQMMGLF